MHYLYVIDKNIHIYDLRRNKLTAQDEFHRFLSYLLCCEIIYSHSHLFLQKKYINGNKKVNTAKSF